VAIPVTVSFDFQLVWFSRHSTEQWLLLSSLENQTMTQHRNIVGPQVRRFRNQHGWSQSVLAAKCQVLGWDVSRGIIAAIEGRVRWVGDFELMILAKVLRAGPLDLLPKQINLNQLTKRKH
jgi:hypothetical protein